MEKKFFATNDGFKLKAVSEPFIGKYDVIIEVYSSFLSPGTEKATFNKIQASTFTKALKYRKQLSDLIRDSDYNTLLKKIKSQKNIHAPSGYSLFGKVLRVGASVSSVRVGQYVVAVGDKANHGTIAVVPQGLLIPCGNNLDYAGSALVAIALNAIEISKFKPFSKICLVGGGLLGQLLIQMLSQAGFEVDIFDLNQNLSEISLKNGANHFLQPTELSGRHNSYHGAIMTVPQCDTEMWSDLAEALQVNANIVLVGAADLNVSRENFYKKRLNFLTAYSYGAGRGEYGYEVLNLKSRLNISGLTPIDQLIEQSICLIDRKIISFGFVDVVDMTTNSEFEENFIKNGAVAYLFKWKDDTSDVQLEKPVEHKFFNAGKNYNGIDVLGNSSYFKDSHMPALKKNKININKLMNRSPLPYKSKTLPDTNSILISTPHDEHWSAIKKSTNYQYIFVDKPILTNRNEYQEFIEFDYNVLALMSRRYSDYTAELGKFINNANGSVKIEFNFCVSSKDKDDPIYFNGGRIVGEMCHHLDLAIYLNGPVNTFETINFDDTKNIATQERLLLFLSHVNGNQSIIKYWPEEHPYFDKEMIYASYSDVFFLIEDFKKYECNLRHLRKLKITERDKGCTNMWSKIKSDIFTNSELTKSWTNVDKQVYEILFRIGM